jgi:tRNA U34 2-thiouridine synthase MnmA/TrmU
MNRMKALGLLSGGLDSTLAVKLVLESGVEVEALNFQTPFGQERKDGLGPSEAAETVNVPLTIVTTGTDYLRMVRNPKFGYGKNMNPCIDCKIFMLKKAKNYAKKIGAKFIFTGEVLGQRPMSQHREALDIIEKEAGLEGKLVRPLCAKLLPKTEAENQGFISKEALRGISGRSRKPQIEMTKEFKIVKYQCASGGCLLTESDFSQKLEDLFQHKTRVTNQDVALLKVGRHFRFDENKIIVGRNQAENEVLMKSKRKGDYCFEVPDCGSPITILQGPKTKKAVEIAAGLTAFHSDQKSGEVHVSYGRDKPNIGIIISIPSKAEVDRLRIC